MHFWYGDMMGWGLVGGGLMLLFWIIIIALIAWGARAITRGGAGRLDQSRRAREILDERYAKGDISKQEYEEKKKDLGS